MSLKYMCADCLENRESEHVIEVEHPDEQFGNIFICDDKPCSVDNSKIGPMNSNSQNQSDDSDYKITDKLE